jgi:hypothetical protein
VRDYKERAGLMGESYPDIVTADLGQGPGSGPEGDGDPTPDPQEA